VTLLVKKSLGCQVPHCQATSKECEAAALCGFGHFRTDRSTMSSLAGRVKGVTRSGSTSAPIAVEFAPQQQGVYHSRTTGELWYTAV
jgi:hypothetical protein